MTDRHIKIFYEKEPWACNCVKWCRTKIRNLPYGLWTIWDKKKIINSHRAKEGRVAIIKTRFKWGHVAIVKYVGSNHLTIKEANYKTCKITERHDSEKNLNIIGYFNPQKKDVQL